MKQLIMAVFGLTAMWIGLGPADHPLRPWAPVIGLAGQPLWFAFAWTAHRKGGYHEEIADDLFRAFGGQQALVADHHGVTIETVRGGDDCAWCEGSGMTDATGRGDLERCDRCSAASKLGEVHQA